MAIPPVAPETPRLRALRNLAGQLPVASQRIAAGQQAARDIQLQQAVAAAPPTTATIPAAQAAGAALAGQAGEQALKTTEAQGQQVEQVGRMGLAEQERQGKAEIASAQLGAGEEKLNQAEQFGNLDEKLKNEYVDKVVNIQTTENGQAILDAKNLSDWAVENAKDEEQYKTWALEAKLASDRNLALMEQAHKLVMEDLTQQYNVAKQKKDQRAEISIRNQMQEADNAMQREKNRDANRNATWTAGGTIIGGAAGAAAGKSAEGGLLGAQAGGGLGSALGKL